MEAPDARIAAGFAEVIAVPDRGAGVTRRKSAALAGDPTITLPRLSGSSEVKPRRRCLPTETIYWGLLAL